MIYILVPNTLSRAWLSIADRIESVVAITFKYSRWSYYLTRLLKTRVFVDIYSTWDFNRLLGQIIRSVKDEGATILIVSGRRINARNSNLLMRYEAIRLIYWYTDSKHRYPDIQSNSTLYESIFYHDGNDYKESIHPNSYWVPYGFDSLLYKPDVDLTKSIDVLFLGNLKQPEYSRRLEYLKLIMDWEGISQHRVVAAVTTRNKKLINRMKKLGIEFVGWQNEENYAQLIKQSKVVINIFQNDGGSPINPLFFAIPFAGSIQLTEHHTYLDEFLTADKHYITINKTNFYQRLTNVLVGKIGISDEQASSLSQKFGFFQVLKDKAIHQELDS